MIRRERSPLSPRRDLGTSRRPGPLFFSKLWDGNSSAFPPKKNTERDAVRQKPHHSFPGDPTRVGSRLGRFFRLRRWSLDISDRRHQPVAVRPQPIARSRPWLMKARRNSQLSQEPVEPHLPPVTNLSRRNGWNGTLGWVKGTSV